MVGGLADKPLQVHWLSRIKHQVIHSLIHNSPYLIVICVSGVFQEEIKQFVLMGIGHLLVSGTEFSRPASNLHDILYLITLALPKLVESCHDLSGRVQIGDINDLLSIRPFCELCSFQDSGLTLALLPHLPVHL